MSRLTFCIECGTPIVQKRRGTPRHRCAECDPPKTVQPTPSGREGTVKLEAGVTFPRGKKYPPELRYSYREAEKVATLQVNYEIWKRSREPLERVIREAHDKWGWTYTEIGDALAMDKAQVHRMVNGRRGKKYKGIVTEKGQNTREHMLHREDLEHLRQKKRWEIRAASGWKSPKQMREEETARVLAEQDDA